MRSLLCLLLLGLQAPDFRSDTALVHVDVEVRAGEHSADELDVSSFRVRDSGKIQPIVSFAHAEEPMEVILLLDTSDSMLTQIKAVAASAHEALRHLRRGDRIAVMAFDCGTTLMSDFTSDFDEIERSLTRVLARTFAGCSLIQLALADAAAQFRNPSGSALKRAVVVITDDYGSARFPTALRSLWAADAVVLGVVVSGTLRRKGPGVFAPGGDKGVKQLAELTGGAIVNVQNASAALGEAFQRLRNRYSLYYVMPRVEPGSTRKIQVELAPAARRMYPDVVIQSRSGYVVPAAVR